MLKLVQLKLRPGAGPEFERLVGELIAEVRAKEPGCVYYSLSKVAGSDTDYWMIEHFASREAFDIHSKAEHFLSVMPKTLPLLDGAPIMIDFDRTL
jgi:quinol monooxygenase YgiN